MCAYRVDASLATWPRGDAEIRVPVTAVWAAPDAPTQADAAMVSHQPRIERWLSSMSHDERLSLVGRASTQALLGEPVITVGSHNGWTEVRLPWQPTDADPQGYPGWIPSAHLIQSVADPGQPLVVLTDRITFHPGLSEPLSGGTILRSDGVGRVWHPEGFVIDLDQGGVPPADSVHAEDSVDAGDPSVPMLLATASSFLGVGYLWSGLSGWGVDCSGLVHLAARMNGLIVPRDSSDQFRAAQRGTLGLDKDSLRWFVHPIGHPRAGLVRHVGMAVSGHRMLHAPRTGFVVELISQAEEPYASDAIACD